MASSQFISKLMLDCFDCITADKNISVSEEYKHILVALEFKDVAGVHFKISAAYSVNLGGKISMRQSVKVAYSKSCSGKVVERGRLVAFKELEVTDELLMAVNDINELFESTDTENKRVFM